MYNEFIPQLTHQISALIKILNKAEAHCEAKNISSERLLNASLTLDMYTFNKQVQTVADLTERAVARLSGQEPQSIAFKDATFEELRTRLTNTQNTLNKVQLDDFTNAAQLDIKMQTPAGEFEMTGHQYLYTFVYPNFYFHMTTAYQILRHNGVELGKMDFLGRA